MEPIDHKADFWVYHTYHGLMYTKNSDSVSHLFVGVGDDMLKQVLPTRLMEDFCHQKSKKLLELFNVKE